MSSVSYSRFDKFDIIKLAQKIIKNWICQEIRCIEKKTNMSNRETNLQTQLMTHNITWKTKSEKITGNNKKIHDVEGRVQLLVLQNSIMEKRRKRQLNSFIFLPQKDIKFPIKQDPLSGTKKQKIPRKIGSISTENWFPFTTP